MSRGNKLESLLQQIGNLRVAVSEQLFDKHCASLKEHMAQLPPAERIALAKLGERIEVNGSPSLPLVHAAYQALGTSPLEGTGAENMEEMERPEYFQLDNDIEAYARAKLRGHGRIPISTLREDLIASLARHDIAEDEDAAAILLDEIDRTIAKSKSAATTRGWDRAN